ncbi:MAG: hypothetical protein KGH66_02220 [Candidatus Micrarchaeota archaeon]|nr:hypothetical protein [Candidatus Micrarchaeota archaeon]
MEGIAKQKVPGGKLLIIKVRYNENIEDIKILGDFFIYPESAVIDIEAAIMGMASRSSEESLIGSIEAAVERAGAEMIGITPLAIAQTLRAAMMK